MYVTGRIFVFIVVSECCTVFCRSVTSPVMLCVTWFQRFVYFSLAQFVIKKYYAAVNNSCILRTIQHCIFIKYFIKTNLTNYISYIFIIKSYTKYTRKL